MSDAFCKAMDKEFEKTPGLFPNGLPEPLAKLRDRLVAVDQCLEAEPKCHLHRENSQYALLSIAEMAVGDFLENSNARIR
jgi:hypothetical protein